VTSPCGRASPARGSDTGGANSSPSTWGETAPDADPAPGYGDDEGYDSLSVSDTDDGDTTAPGADPAPGYGTPSSSCGNRHNWVELRRTPGTPALCCSLCTVDLWRPPAAGATGGTPEVLRCLECGIAVHGAHVPGAPGSSTDAHGTVVTVRHVDDEDGGQDAESFSSFSDSADDDEDSVDSDSDSDDDTTTYICTGCLERYALRGDKPAWRCTDMACVKALYCPDCITDYTERLDDGSHVCGSCKVALVTQVSNRRQRTERIERPFGTKLTNSSWQPGHRVPQGRTMLCYAAAVATACRCAGYPATLLECMHAFLMSEKVEQSVGVLAYRRDFEAARRAAPDKPPADVLNDMEGLFAGTMKTAVSIGGVPVFPDGFTGDPLFQQNMTPAQVVAALDQGMVVMAGDKSHWVVIIGYRSDNGVVSYFEYFDPAGVGAVVLDRWDTQWVDFYCVRA